MFPLDIKRTLLAAYSRANGFTRAIRPEEVTFGLATLWLQGGCNTRITFTAVEDNGFFSGSQEIFYNRLRLDLYTQGLAVPGSRADYTTIHEVVDALVDQYGLPLTRTEIINGTPDAESVTLQPVSNSLGWFNSYPATLPFAA